VNESTLNTLASHEAESGILGALLLDNNALDRVSDRLKPEHFFNALNREVYAEVCAQVLAGKQADVITVFQAMGGRIGLDDLNALAQFVPSAANIRRYADTVIERAKSRGLMSVSAEITELAQDHARSIEDRVEAAQGQLSKLIDDAPRDDWVSAHEGAIQHIDTLEDRAEGKMAAWSTGLPDLDEILEGGMRPGELVVVGARPSMGKTALAMTIGLNMAADYTVGMLSMEMPHSELRDRQTAILGKISLSTVKRPSKGLQWDSVVDGVEKAKNLNWYASDQGGLNINQVRSKARNLKRLHGLNMLIIDYIGLMSGLDGKQQRAYQLEEISRGLKNLAKELGIAVLCLAQVNRKVEDRAEHAPVLSDLRDSGAIEQDADVVMFVHRPIQQKPDLPDDFKNYAKVTIAKNRQGRCGVVNMAYIGDQTRFGSWSGAAPNAKTSYAYSSKKGFGHDD
jgi:replicative DNA helicase